MGVYDVVMVKCPACGHENEFQSKGGDCYLHHYKLNNAPNDVLSDINKDAPIRCCNCNANYEVFIQIIAVPVIV